MLILDTSKLDSRSIPCWLTHTEETSLGLSDSMFGGRRSSDSPFGFAPGMFRDRAVYSNRGMTDSRFQSRVATTGSSHIQCMSHHFYARNAKGLMHKDLLVGVHLKCLLRHDTRDSRTGRIGILPALRGRLPLYLPSVG